MASGVRKKKYILTITETYAVDAYSDNDAIIGAKLNMPGSVLIKTEWEVIGKLEKEHDKKPK